VVGKRLIEGHGSGGCVPLKSFSGQYHSAWHLACHGLKSRD
jgi:hypothetical protein